MTNPFASPYKAFFSGSIIEPTTISGNNIIVDKDIQLEWPSFYIEDAIPFNRIMNFSVLGEFRVYLPAANQSSVFSDALFINLGPFPLVLYYYDGTLFKIIEGTPSYTYSLLTTPVPFANAFFNITNPNPEIAAQTVEFTSSVAAQSLLLMGTGEDSKTIEEVLDLSNGTTRTTRKFKSFKSIINLSDVPIKNMTARIPPVQAAAAFSYTPTKLTIPVFDPANQLADLKQIFDVYREPQNLRIQCNSEQAHDSASFIIFGYKNGLFDSEEFSFVGDAGHNVKSFTTETKFSAVSYIRNTGQKKVLVQIDFPAVNGKASFRIMNGETIDKLSICSKTNYQQHIAPRSLTLTYTIPAGAVAGTIQINGHNTSTLYSVTEIISTPANTGAAAVTKVYTTTELFCTVQSLTNTSTSSLTFTNVKLQYPENNGLAEVTMISIASLPQKYVIPLSAIINPTLYASPLKISAKGNGPVAITITGTAAHGGPESEVVFLKSSDVKTPTVLSNTTIKQFVTVISCFNTADQLLTNFSITAHNDSVLGGYFTHVESVDLNSIGSNIFKRIPNTPQTNIIDVITQSVLTPPHDLVDYNDSVLCVYEADNPQFDFAFELDISASTTINYDGDATIVAAANGTFYDFYAPYNLQIKTDYCSPSDGTTILHSDTTVWQGPANAPLAYPFVFLPPSQYEIHSKGAVSVDIIGFIPGTDPYEEQYGNHFNKTLNETVDVPAGGFVTTQNTFWTIDQVVVNSGSSESFSIINPRKKYNENEYPDFHIVEDRPVSAKDNFTTHMNRRYLDASPNLLMTFDSGPAYLAVTGINEFFESQTINTSTYNPLDVNTLTKKFFFVTKIESATTTPNVVCAYAPSANVLQVDMPNYSKKTTNKSITHITNQYFKGDIAKIGTQGAYLAILSKLPPPFASVLEIWCDEIFASDKTTPLSNASIYIRGMNLRHPIDVNENFEIEENVDIIPGLWVQTKNQYLYLLLVTTHTDYHDGPAQQILIKGLKVRSVFTVPKDYTFNNTTTLEANKNTIAITTNPSPAQGAQPLLISANNGALIEIIGENGAKTSASETFSIGKSGIATSSGRYTSLLSVTNIGREIVSNCNIEGLKVDGIAEWIFVKSSETPVPPANKVPLLGNPPSTYPDKNLEINSSVASDAGKYLLIEGSDSSEEIITEQLPLLVANENSLTQNQYGSLLNVWNLTGQTLTNGFSIKAPAIEGLTHYIYTSDNSSQKGEWEHIPFGAFLSEEKGKSIAGSGLFFNEHTLNENVETIIITGLKNLKITAEHSAKALVYTEYTQKNRTSVAWTLPLAADVIEIGMFFYAYNIQSSTQDLTLGTSGNDCINSDTKIKSFTLNSGDSALFVAITGGWAIICSNNTVMQPAGTTFFPVAQETKDIDEGWFTIEENQTVINCVLE